MICKFMGGFYVLSNNFGIELLIVQKLFTTKADLHNNNLPYIIKKLRDHAFLLILVDL